MTPSKREPNAAETAEEKRKRRRTLTEQALKTDPFQGLTAGFEADIEGFVVARVKSQSIKNSTLPNEALIVSDCQSPSLLKIYSFEKDFSTLPEIVDGSFVSIGKALIKNVKPEYNAGTYPIEVAVSLKSTVEVVAAKKNESRAKELLNKAFMSKYGLHSADSQGGKQDSSQVELEVLASPETFEGACTVRVIELGTGEVVHIVSYRVMAQLLSMRLKTADVVTLSSASFNPNFAKGGVRTGAYNFSPQSKLRVSRAAKQANSAAKVTNLKDLTSTGVLSLHDCEIDVSVVAVCGSQLEITDGKHRCYGVYEEIYDHSTGEQLPGSFAAGDQARILTASIMKSNVNGIAKLHLRKITKYPDDADDAIDYEQLGQVKPIEI